ncbi:hypothetical protein Tcan_13587 [Toxocara canis]|uniref:Uncharacterized protein n=1 Tax=Toxocara canis TaxID=6265 RepID=A0A0B2W513_TOXCA|nr:hypothetical protein Tcan_13587 [Toxocara canis]
MHIRRQLTNKVTQLETDINYTLAIKSGIDTPPQDKAHTNFQRWVIPTTNCDCAAYKLLPYTVPYSIFKICSNVPCVNRMTALNNDSNNIKQIYWDNALGKYSPKQ